MIGALRVNMISFLTCLTVAMLHVFSRFYRSSRKLSVDLDYLASSEASWSGSILFSEKNVFRFRRTRANNIHYNLAKWS